MVSRWGLRSILSWIFFPSSGEGVVRSGSCRGAGGVVFPRMRAGLIISFLALSPVCPWGCGFVCVALCYFSWSGPVVEGGVQSFSSIGPFDEVCFRWEVTWVYDPVAGDAVDGGLSFAVERRGRVGGAVFSGVVEGGFVFPPCGGVSYPFCII